MAATPLWEASLLSFVANQIHHHGRFYLAMAIGLGALIATRHLPSPLPEAIGGDSFFVSFLIMSWWLIFRMTSADLRLRADVEDEGGIAVTIITVGAIGYASFAVFESLHGKSLGSPLTLVLALAGAPLGWFMLHTVSAVRYAHLYYNNDEEEGYVPPLKFPECLEPGPWDFMYFALVIGMTAQVSDALVQTTEMRMTVLAHSVVSFFFNTVLIAMAVNAAVAIAS
ncbi:MAG TPA: DUF1345 domain-containing protein [Rhizomicrobium sp.]|nr:DUF1345 domain-containing protein [Rhizomicrobium sp.]